MIRAHVMADHVGITVYIIYIYILQVCDQFQPGRTSNMQHAYVPLNIQSSFKLILCEKHEQYGVVIQAGNASMKIDGQNL